MILDSADIELGPVAGPVAHFVDPDEVVAFSLAINDGRAAYTTGAAVPPTYVVTPTLPVVHTLPPYPGSVRAALHGEQDMVLHKPITPGTWIHTTVSRVGAIPTKGGMLVEQIARAVDGGGDLLVEQHWVVILVGPEATGEPRGQAPPDHAFPAPARDRPAGRITLPTTRDQTFRYAGASSDRSPIHTNDEFARSRGFPRKFNQGLCTLGIVSGGLISLAAGGDPGRVARLAARFSAPAFPGDDIELSVYELGHTPGGCQAFAFEAESGGRPILRHGRFEVAPLAG